ncbi:hypothetical protein QL996_00125 [Planococcus sp. APC 4015]|nr:hypothetical protein [Planococcus sp. APC 4015]
MTKNRRYEAHYDRLNDQRSAAAAERPAPVTLPPAAWEPLELDWSHPAVPVWAWLQWATGPAEKLPCLAHAWNQRVVLVSWEPGGLPRTVFVWRQAVTRRASRGHSTMSGGE